MRGPVRRMRGDHELRRLQFLALVIGGCGGLTEDTVRADFMSEHPGAAVVSTVR